MVKFRRRTNRPNIERNSIGRNSVCYGILFVILVLVAFFNSLNRSKYDLNNAVLKSARQQTASQNTPPNVKANDDKKGSGEISVIENKTHVLPEVSSQDSTVNKEEGKSAEAKDKAPDSPKESLDKAVNDESEGGTADSEKKATDHFKESPEEIVKNVTELKSSEAEGSPVHILQCETLGGPDNKYATDEMMYWSDIPSDARFVSPFKSLDLKEGREKFITFEPDVGAFNNMRMAWENIVALAVSTGRTLVMLPERYMPMIAEGTKGQKNEFTFKDFYLMQEIEQEHPGLKIMGMEQFLRQSVGGGYLPDPPNNEFNWDNKDLDELLEYLQTNAYSGSWKPGECVCVFPTDTNYTSVLQDLREVLAEHRAGKSQFGQFIAHPTPVNASVKDRFREIQDGRKKFCTYTEEMRNATVVHFGVDNEIGQRLLVPFEAFHFFESWKQDLWLKRFIRDHMRYRDEFMCAAARIVRAIRDRAKANLQKRLNTTDEGILGEFNTAHIRRGDFADQYAHTQLSADSLRAKSQNYFEKGSTLYILTDEKDKKFFQPLKEEYDVCFLEDFFELLEDVNTNYYGMIEQLIAARGKVFIGTYLSTFSAHINRLRGYYSTKKKLPGYQDGIIDSYYFDHDPNTAKVMRKYFPVHGPYWAREFPVAWRDIDYGIDGA